MKALQLASALFLTALILGTNAPAFAATIFATTEDDQLITFDSATPGTIDRSVAISGLAAGEDVVAIDFRPATGQLYGLSYSLPGGVDTIQLLTITTDTDPAVVTRIGAPSSPFDRNFGFDFDPVSDEIRVVNNLNDNLRFDPDTGLIVIDTDLSPASASVMGLAYGNSFNGATAATLFGIDLFPNNQLVMIGGVDGVPSPNEGAVTNVGMLGTSIAPPGEFDIGEDGAAFAVYSNFTIQNLYTVDLGSGLLTLVGAVDASSGVIVGIAVQPEPSQVQFGAPNYTVDESAGTVTVTVTRTGNTLGVDTVDFAASGGTATAGADYSAISGTLSFANGVTSLTFDVPILDDPDVEGDEAVTLTLSNPNGGATLSTPNPAVLTIADNDVPIDEIEGSGCGLSYHPPNGSGAVWTFLAVFFVPILILRQRIRR